MHTYEAYDISYMNSGPKQLFLKKGMSTTQTMFLNFQAYGVLRWITRYNNIIHVYISIYIYIYSKRFAQSASFMVDYALL